MKLLDKNNIEILEHDIVLDMFNNKYEVLENNNFAIIHHFCEVISLEDMSSIEGMLPLTKIGNMKIEKGQYSSEFNQLNYPWIDRK